MGRPITLVPRRDRPRDAAETSSTGRLDHSQNERKLDRDSSGARADHRNRDGGRKTALVAKERTKTTADSRSPSRSDRRNVFFVGIAGPSGSGKTSLASELCVQLGSPFYSISMDWFSNPAWMPHCPVFKEKNWETPDGIDFDKLTRELRKVSATLASAERVPDAFNVGGDKFGQDVVREGEGGRRLNSDHVFVVVEGFLLFYDTTLCNLLDLHIWLDADCETCVYRRHFRARNKKAADIDKTRQWFDGQIWPHYKRNRRTQLDNAGNALHLDATLDFWELSKQAAEYCEKQLEKLQRKRKRRLGGRSPIDQREGYDSQRKRRSMNSPQSASFGRDNGWRDAHGRIRSNGRNGARSHSRDYAPDLSQGRRNYQDRDPDEAGSRKRRMLR